MITGQVNEDIEPVVMLSVYGTAGMVLTVPVVVDTGFSEYLSLTPDFIAGLSLPFKHYAPIKVADGREVAVAVYEAVILWDGQDKAIEVHEMEQFPVIGMALICDYFLAIEAVNGGQVTIEALP